MPSSVVRAQKDMGHHAEKTRQNPMCAKFKLYYESCLQQMNSSTVGCAVEEEDEKSL